MEDRLKKDIDIGDYTVTIYPRLKRGKFADIYQACNTKNDKPVVFKELATSIHGHSEELLEEKIQSEICILRLLQGHRNIIGFLDHIIKPEAHYIVLEICKYNLKECLSSKRDLKSLFKLDIMLQCTNVVKFLHTRQPPIIHWDIKLEHVLILTRDSNIIVKLTDFGLSQQCENSSGTCRIKNKFGTLYGSETYAAPEFYDSFVTTSNITLSVDTFALGLLFSVLHKHNVDHAMLTPLPGNLFISIKTE